MLGEPSGPHNMFPFMIFASRLRGAPPLCQFGDRLATAACGRQSAARPAEVLTTCLKAYRIGTIPLGKLHNMKVG
jgi:hypothetical protein